eukprot:2105935-Heterocapsa_arctica.AAC.1
MRRGSGQPTVPPSARMSSTVYMTETVALPSYSLVWARSTWIGHGIAGRRCARRRCARRTTSAGRRTR